MQRLRQPGREGSQEVVGRRADLHGVPQARNTQATSRSRCSRVFSLNQLSIE